MKSIKFERVVIQAGSDSTGVATDMVTMNSSVKLTFRNTATFFRVHVTASPIEISFSELNLATGTVIMEGLPTGYRSIIILKISHFFCDEFNRLAGLVRLEFN